MNAEVVAQTIQLIIAPTVMVSVCTMIQSGILNRYNQISDRLRSLVRERAELLLDAAELTETLYREALHIIDVQLLSLSRRHLRIQRAVLTVYGSILVFLSVMIAIAVAQTLDSTVWAVAALGLFLLGTLILVAGVILISRDVQVSHLAVQFEVRQVLHLEQDRTRNYQATALARTG